MASPPATRRVRIGLVIEAALWVPAAAALSQEVPSAPPAVEPPELRAIPLEDLQERAEACRRGVSFPQRDLHLRTVSPNATSELGVKSPPGPEAPAGTPTPSRR